VVQSPLGGLALAFMLAGVVLAGVVAACWLFF
jgi:hypothetical protein